MRGKVSFSEIGRRDALIASLARQNIPVSEIAGRFGLKEARVLQILKKRKVKAPEQKGLTNWEIEKRDADIEKLALQEHPLLSTKKIAEMKGLSERRVEDILRKRDVRALNEEMVAKIRKERFVRRAWLYTRASAKQIGLRVGAGERNVRQLAKKANIKRKYALTRPRRK